MNRTEPTLAPLATDPDSAAFAAWRPDPVHRVRFAVMQPRARPPYGVATRSLPGKGELALSDELIVLEGRTRAAFRTVPSRVEIRPEQVFDAGADGRFVHFDIRAEEGIRRVLLKARSPADAEAILAALPAQTTPECRAQHIAHAGFAERTRAIAPVTWVTYALIAANVLVFMMMCASGVGIIKANPVATLGWGTNFGPYTHDGQWWRLVTSTFVHFGIRRLTLNMIALYVSGRVVERLYGSGRFLALYLFAGVTGSVASTVWHPLYNSAGASGAIFGVFGALLAFALRFHRELPASFVAKQRALLLYAAYSLVTGFSHAGTDNVGHLGGLVGGLLIGLPLARTLDPEARKRVAIESASLAFTIASVVWLALSYPLTHANSPTAAEMRFQRALLGLPAAEKKALYDMAVLAHRPTDTQPERDALATAILTGVAPQWDALHATFDGARPPDGSPRAPLSDALLRYLDDRQKLCRVLADRLEHAQSRNRASQTELQALKDDIAAQIATIKQLRGVKKR